MADLEIHLFRIEKILESMLEVQRLRAKVDIITADWDSDELLKELSEIRLDIESSSPKPKPPPETE